MTYLVELLSASNCKFAVVRGCLYLLVVTDLMRFDAVHPRFVDSHETGV